jgi:hypothetical protein
MMIFLRLRYWQRGYGGGWLDGRCHGEKYANRLAVGVDEGAGTLLRGYWRDCSTVDLGC